MYFNEVTLRPQHKIKAVGLAKAFTALSETTKFGHHTADSVHNHSMAVHQ